MAEAKKKSVKRKSSGSTSPVKSKKSAKKKPKKNEASVASPAEKAKYLKSLVAAKKVATPSEAHAALKKKFEKSLPFWQVGPILAGNPVPAKRQAKKAKKVKKAKKAGKVGRPRGTGKKSLASNSPSYLILSGREFKTADRKGDLGGVIEKFIAAGHDLNKLSVYQRVPKVKIERRVSVSL